MIRAPAGGDPRTDGDHLDVCDRRAARGASAAVPARGAGQRQWHLAFGAGGRSDPKLQAATAEIQAIADLFEARDRDAKVKLFAGDDGDANTLHTLWSSGADVVHFATHALADLRQPLASLLVLPAKDAAGAPAYLTAGQVQEWRGDVGLVFLSACESAIGPPRFAGGMPGLQSAFLRAGARGVIRRSGPSRTCWHANSPRISAPAIHPRGVGGAGPERDTTRMAGAGQVTV